MLLTRQTELYSIMSQTTQVRWWNIFQTVVSAETKDTVTVDESSILICSDKRAMVLKWTQAMLRIYGRINIFMDQSNTMVSFDWPPSPSSYSPCKTVYTAKICINSLLKHELSGHVMDNSVVYQCDDERWQESTTCCLRVECLLNVAGLLLENNQQYIVIT